MITSYHSIWFAIMMLLFAIFPRVQQFFTWNVKRIDRLFVVQTNVRTFVHSLIYLSVCHKIRASSTIVIKLYYPVPWRTFSFPAPLSLYLLSFPFHLLCLACNSFFFLMFALFVVVVFVFSLFFFWSIVQFISKIKNDGAILWFYFSFSSMNESFFYFGLWSGYDRLVFALCAKNCVASMKQ